MLSDGRLNALDTRLEQFKLNNHTAQTDLHNLLQEYGQLLEDYKILRKICEDKARNNRGITPVNNVPLTQNPHVLVLVDGNGYIFNDELILAKEEGGMRAARMLNDAVEQYIQHYAPEAQNSRVVVRVYADLTNLSKQLAKLKLTGLEKRSIGSFSAGFSRAISTFDFVDTLDEEGTKFKIRESLKWASEDSTCSHILLAACQDNAYLSQVVPLSGRRDKITLVQGASWLPDFHQFNLNVTQFPTIFRWSELSILAPSVKVSNQTVAPSYNAQKKLEASAPLGTRQVDSWLASSVSPGATGPMVDMSNGFKNKHESNTDADTEGPQRSSQQPCKFFSKGYCRFGSKCNFQHGPVLHAGQNHDSSVRSLPRHTSVSSELPTSIPPGLIPLNKHSERLDTYIRPPSGSEWATYNARFNRQKPCNNFHLQRACTTYDCPFDHSELEPEVRRVLEYVLKCSSCPQKGKCRTGNCYYGHLCQKDGCQGKLKGCKMKADLHGVDPMVAIMVPADDVDEAEHAEGVPVPAESGYLW